MASEQEILDEMSRVCDELIVVATELRDAARSSLDKKELERLQNKQTAVVQKLLKLGQSRGSNVPSQETMDKHIAAKIAEFAKINGEFVNQLKGRASGIQFSK